MDSKRKYFCIFGGGAVRGLAYIGAYRALLEQDIEIAGLAGSSVGAVFSALLACGVSLEDLEKILFDVNFYLFKDLNIGIGSGFALSKGGVFLDWLRENLEKSFYGDDYKKGENPPICFKDLKTKLVIITTDLTNCKPYIFSKELTPDFEVAEAVRISSSMPGLMKPLEVNGSLLCDGDLMKSIPLWKLCDCANEDERILEFRLEGLCPDKSIKSIADYLNTVYSCMTNYSTDFIMELYGENDKYDYIKIDTKDLIIVNFNISQEQKKDLLKIGYNITQKFFNIKLPKKKKTLLSIYEYLRNKALSVQSTLEKNFVAESKTAILEFFPMLVESEKLIDVQVYKEIVKFKNIFFQNMYKNMFGIDKMHNEKFVNAHLKKLIAQLDDKIAEMQ